MDRLFKTRNWGVAEGRSYYENVKSIARCSFQNDIDKLNKPVDRTSGIYHRKR
jgi:predicted metalloendopeptidase